MTYLEEDNEQWVLQRNIKKAKNVKEMRSSCCFLNQENEKIFCPASQNLTSQNSSVLRDRLIIMHYIYFIAQSPQKNLFLNKLLNKCCLE